jgi:hypothetical protein
VIVYTAIFVRVDLVTLTIAVFSATVSAFIAAKTSGCVKQPTVGASAVDSFIVMRPSAAKSDMEITFFFGAAMSKNGP